MTVPPSWEAIESAVHRVVEASRVLVEAYEAVTPAPESADPVGAALAKLRIAMDECDDLIMEYPR